MVNMPVALATMVALILCGSQPPPPSWKTFLDKVRGFCFYFPPPYHPTTTPGGGDAIATLINEEKAGASITLSLSKSVFSLHSLTKLAPTGQATPPDPIRLGSNTFDYYGPGGGGVAYPDRYYLNFQNRTLKFSFDGPYPSDSKSPSAASRQIEHQILSTFHLLP